MVYIQQRHQGTKNKGTKNPNQTNTYSQGHSDSSHQGTKKTKPNKTGHPSKLVLKQQTEGAAIKNRKSSSWGRWVYLER
jgi:hypothetical protein